MAPLLFFLLFLLSEAASEPEVIRVVQVKLGQDATLPCHTDVINIRAAEWTRSKPEPPTDILFWTDGHIRSPIKDRVQLVDGELKTGDVSMILKDVKREDSGTYECRVITAGSRRNKRANIDSDPISIVELQVTDPDPVVKVEQVGQDVILPCRAGDVTIRAAEWIRSDLVHPNYVLFYSDGRLDPKHQQHSSFTGRVQLVDGELKTGDVSMILKDVKREDNGTYECRVQTAASRRNKTETISIVQLQVTDPDPVVKVVPVGQDVILPCRAGDVTITAAEWTRSDLVHPNYVLLHSDGPSDPKHQQHSSFTGRVQLVNDELKTGDVSLILKDVKREDNGTYECRVQAAASRRNKRAIIKTEPISRVQLQVTDPENNKGDNKDGHNGDADNGNSPRLYVGLAAVVVFLLVLAAVGLFLVRKCKRQREKKPEPSAAGETGDNLL